MLSCAQRRFVDTRVCGLKQGQRACLSKDKTTRRENEKEASCRALCGLGDDCSNSLGDARNRKKSHGFWCACIAAAVHSHLLGDSTPKTRVSTASQLITVCARSLCQLLERLTLRQQGIGTSNVL